MKTSVKIGLICSLAALAAGCTSIRDRRGFVADETLLQGIQPGLDNRQSVAGTLGQPSFKSQFGADTWYYVSSTTEQKPFGAPEIAGHTVLAVTFDAQGNVVSAQRTGMDQVAEIDPESDSTPTLGRERGLLEDIFGNIGQVGGGALPGGAGGTGQ